MHLKASHLISLVVISLVLMNMAAASAAGPREVDDNALTRRDLPDVVATTVRDQAIEVANERAFDAVRRAWNSDSTLVQQIDYQLDFRSRVDFMDSSSDHLAALLLERPSNYGSQEMGLYMTSDEVAEMRRRDRLGDRMESVVEILTGVGPGVRTGSEDALPQYGPLYGGVWQDQKDGGKIVVAVTDRNKTPVDRLVELVGDRKNIVVIEQPFSYNELESYRDELEQQLLTIELPPHVLAVWGDEGRRLEVTVREPKSLPPDFGASVPEAAYTIVEGVPFQPAGYPNHVHNSSDLQAGLQLGVSSNGGSSYAGCGWGFNGHTNTSNYIVLAGHCLGPYGNENGDYEPDVVLRHNWGQGTHLLTPTSNGPFIRSRDNSTYDVARVQSIEANTNCYHGDPAGGSSAHCEWRMSTRSLAGANRWELGSDRTCSSLSQTNDYRCGYVVDDYFGPNRLVVDMIVNGGDSGSGAKWGNRIDGILTDRSLYQAFFQTAYHTQVALGSGYFYFNCATGKTTHSNASNWGSCPAVDP